MRALRRLPINSLVVVRGPDLLAVFHNLGQGKIANHKWRINSAYKRPQSSQADSTAGPLRPLHSQEIARIG